MISLHNFAEPILGMLPMGIRLFGILLIVGLTAGLDILIVWLVWRAVSRPLNGAVVGPPVSPPGPVPKFPAALSAAGCFFIVAVFPAFLQMTTYNWTMATAFAAVTLICLITTAILAIVALSEINSSPGRYHGRPLAWFCLIGAACFGLIVMFPRPRQNRMYSFNSPGPGIPEIVIPNIPPPPGFPEPMSSFPGVPTPTAPGSPAGASPEETNVDANVHAGLEARYDAASGIREFSSRDTAMAEIVGAAAKAGDLEMARRAVAGIKSFPTRDEAAGGAAKEFLGQERRTGAFEIAQLMTSFPNRDEIMQEVVKSAAAAGQADLTKRALARMTSFSSRDEAAQSAALALAKAGQRAAAVEVARSITQFSLRDDTLGDLAK